MKIIEVETFLLDEFPNLTFVRLQLPATPHDCVGPASFTVAMHLSVSTPNTPIQEFVRAFYTSWYRELVTELPRVSDGHVEPLTGPGLGTQLLPDVVSSRGAPALEPRMK